MTGVAPGVRTHSVRWTDDGYAGAVGWFCQGCKTLWPDSMGVDAAELNQEPCPGRPRRPIRPHRAPDPGSEAPDAD